MAGGDGPAPVRGDRERWDARHGHAGDGPPRPPDPLLLEALGGRAAHGRALDLACGTGRHALELARRGWTVEAWDVSPAGLRLLERNAARAGLAVRTRAVDLVAEDVPADSGTFDLVVLVDFLHRPLHPQLHRLLAPGGELVLVTFTDDWPGEHPSARYRLRPGELARGLPGLEPLRAEERGGRALLHARCSSASPG